MRANFITVDFDVPIKSANSQLKKDTHHKYQ